MSRDLPTPKESFERLRNLPQVKKWRDKNYEPGSWLTAKPAERGGSWGSWGHTFTPNKRGVSLVELNRADPHPVPDDGAGLSVEREGGAEPGAARYNYPLNKKYQVWSANVVGLYEEAVSRQWSATKDIPWAQIQPLPEDQERAMCQFLTFLHTVEFPPTDTLPYYMSRIDPAFPEVRLFLATQCADESRHMEVFGKRTFANGGGPGMEPGAAALLQVNKGNAIMPMDIVRQAGIMNPEWEFLAIAYYMQLLGEGVVLDFFRCGEFLGQNPCDKEIFRRVMQDEARHVSFGTMRIKYYLENAPKAERERALEMLHFFASVSEAGGIGFNLMTSPSAIEPFAVLAAGGYTHIERGWDFIREFWTHQVREYLDRCERAGFSRRDKCLLPLDPPF